jgi:hypothetical protein
LPTAARIGAFSGFETALDPKFARAQRRYLGASGSVDHHDLRGWIPATAFTMSIQFHQHPAATLSSVDLGGARIRVLAGDAYATDFAGRDLVAAVLCRRCAAAGGELLLPREHAERAAYVVGGAVCVGAERAERGRMLVFAPGAEVALRG